MTEHQLGDWIVERLIVNGATGVVIAVNGWATLRRAAGPRLRYDEAVAFWFGGKSIRATRTYFYRPTGDAIVATFADDRPFFTASVRLDGTATALHHCGDDVYVGTLALRAGEVWHTRWEITGSKMLDITTRYVRPIADREARLSRGGGHGARRAADEGHGLDGADFLGRGP